MKIIQVEIRDRGTLIPALVIITDEVSSPLLRRAGIQGRRVLLVRLDSDPPEIRVDPYDWPISSRTMHVAHLHVLYANDLVDGCVVDVEYVLGETTKIKEPECR